MIRRLLKAFRNRKRRERSKRYRYTVLNRCDIVNDICANDQPKFDRRPMHAVLAHESMHQLIADDLGLLAYICLPTWKNEGYCEYVAGNPSFNVMRGETLVRSGKSHGSHAFRYLTYHFAVRSCLDNEKLQPKELFSQPLDFQTSLGLYVGDPDGGSPIDGDGAASARFKMVNQPSPPPHRQRSSSEVCSTFRRSQ